MARSDFTVFGLVLRVHAGMQRLAAAHLHTSGVSPFEQWLLEEIPADGRASASELAERLEVPTSTVTRALRRMESWGYVEVSKGWVLDARVLRSRLTPTGAAVRDACRGFETEIDRLLLEHVRAGAHAGLVQGLRDILRELARRAEEGDRETAGYDLSSGQPSA